MVMIITYIGFNDWISDETRIMDHACVVVMLYSSDCVKHPALC